MGHTGSLGGSQAVSASYLVKRNGVYHYRRRVPSDIEPYVGKAWWKQSLKTAIRRDAEEKARALAKSHDDLRKTLKKRLKDTPRVDRHAALLDVIEDSHSEVGSDDVPADVARRVAVATAAAEELKTQILKEAEHRMSVLDAGEAKSVALTGGLAAFFRHIEQIAKALESDTNTIALRKALGGATRDNDERAAVLEVRKGHVAKDQSTLTKLGLLPEDAGADLPNNPRIKAAMETWFQERKQGPAAVKRHRTSVKRFVELHGNVRIADITKQMVRDYLKAIENLADQRRVPTEKRGGLFDPGEDVPRVSAPTVERHLASIKALLTFGIEQDWITVNVATGLKAPKDTRPKASKRRSFTRDERNQLLRHAISEYGEDADMTWLVRLTAYTGCRLEELAQLARENVRQIDGVWVVDVNDLDERHVKTDDSVKTIPLHPSIRDLFVAWVQSGSGKRVFSGFVPDKTGRFANALSGDFARLMDRANLSDPRLVHHSLRHTLKREMSNARLDPDVRRAILGHAAKDAHDRYDGPSLEAIADEFSRLPPLFDD